jgi:hypothetical protein
MILAGAFVCSIAGKAKKMAEAEASALCALARW